MAMYMQNNTMALEKYLDKEVFKDIDIKTMQPTQEEVAGFNEFMQKL